MELVNYEKRDGIAFIQMNRPESLNALNTQLHGDLALAWKDFRDDDSVRIAILTGAGRAFCAGADLKERAALAVAEDRTADTQRKHMGERQPDRFGLPAGHNVHKPIIAAIQGYCVGGGHGLAMSCDIRIASRDARFGDVEIKAGQVGRIDMVAKTYPLAVANYMGLTGDVITAEQAYQWGFVSHLVDEPHELLPLAEEIANKVLSNPPMAVNAYKDVSLHASRLHGDLGYLFHAARGVLMQRDYDEAVIAFSEKRKGQYKGE